jgi:hypothetical protein
MEQLVSIPRPSVLRHPGGAFAMKYVLIILALVVVMIGLRVLRSWFDQGVSGESATIGDSFVLAEFGYGRGGRLTYAVIRSFPTNSTFEQRDRDPRYRETSSGVFIRDNNGQMIPVARDGTVYFFDGEHLRTMKVKALESDVGLGGSSRSLDEVWASFQRFQVHTNN